MPVAFANRNRSEACLAKTSGVEQNLQHSIVVRFCHVVRRLFVIGIGTILEQQTRETGMLCKPRDSVDGCFMQWPRRSVDVLGPSRIRVSSGFEQSPRSIHKRFRACLINTQIARKADIGQRIPSVRTTFRRGKRSITLQEGADGRCISKDGGAVDVRRAHLWVTRTNHFRVFEGSRTVPAMAINACNFEEGMNRIT